MYSDSGAVRNVEDEDTMRSIRASRTALRLGLVIAIREDPHWPLSVTSASYIVTSITFEHELTEVIIDIQLADLADKL